MRVAARRGMWGFGVALLLLAACGEPGAGAATGPAPALDPAAEVALLAVVEGDVRVRDGAGVEAPARAEQPLRRGDTVVTSPGSLAVVVLANGYVLKLEEDQATPVRALAHLDDPPPAESVAELFEKALGAEALARVGGADRLERIAGWNARRASGETPAPVTRSEPPPAPKAADVAAPEAPAAPIQAGAPVEEAARGEGAPRPDVKADKQRERDEDEPASADAKKAGKAAKPAPSRADPPESAKDEKGSKSSEPGQGGPPGGAPAPQAPAPEPEAKAPDLADAWIFETGPNEQVTRTSLPEGLRSQRAALAQCVAAARPGVAAPELRLRVAGGVVREVALGGGEPAPACARGLVGKPLAGLGGDGWMLVRVRR